MDGTLNAAATEANYHAVYDDFKQHTHLPLTGFAGTGRDCLGNSVCIAAVQGWCSEVGTDSRTALAPLLPGNDSTRNGGIHAVSG